jgi:hypothetical protein
MDSAQPQQIFILENSGGTALTVDSSQRVGIGSTSFGGKLTVKTSSSNGAPVAWGDGQLVVTAGDGTTAPGFGISTNTSDNSVSLSALTPGTGWNNLHLRAAQTIFYKSDAASNEVGRWDASGRLLIGTSSARGVGDPLPSTLEVEGANYNSISIVNNTNDIGSPSLKLGKSRGTTTGSNTIVQNGDFLGSVVFAGADGADLETPAATISAVVDGTPGANDMPGRLVFSTTADGASSSTERMRITSGGFIGINNTNPVNYLAIIGDGATANIRSRQSPTSSVQHIVFNNNNGDVGAISTNASSTVYSTSSDYRLKENVTAVIDGITRLQQLKPSRFNFIADPNTVVDGFLAHEAQEVVPECVTGEKDAVDDDGNPVYQGIDQSKLVPLLTAALQEAIGRIETLEGMVAVNNITIDEQQHQLSTLAARLTALESA